MDGPLAFHIGKLLTSFGSLEKQPNRRASPWKMMEHPWMIEMRSKRVNMVKYLSYVWGWDDSAPATQAA
jgi:hypothetical protein